MCRRKLLKKLDALHKKYDKRKRKFLRERAELLSAIQRSIIRPIVFK